jgi:hypothetical protein
MVYLTSIKYNALCRDCPIMVFRHAEKGPRTQGTSSLSESRLQLSVMQVLSLSHRLLESTRASSAARIQRVFAWRQTINDVHPGSGRSR